MDGMIKEVKYSNVNWAENTPISGERLATNGHYTGEFKGTPMQDAKNADANAPHYVEGAIVRLGTMMGDAADTAYPAKAE
jgi:hypothetical protein